MKRLVRFLFVLFGIGVGLMGTTSCNNPKSLEAITVSEIDLSRVGDGIYRGSYRVNLPLGTFVGQPSAEVEVNVATNRIQSIRLLNMPEWVAQSSDMKVEALIDKIIAEQKLQVDVISGASYTKKAVQKAIENAFRDHLIKTVQR